MDSEISQGPTRKKPFVSALRSREEGNFNSRGDLEFCKEAQSLGRLAGQYCHLEPPPRSTIAADFSNDGEYLASTHGDHTVKVIECSSKRCVTVLSGHRRTPWVVRFHPQRNDILASGSLDHEVRIWDRVAGRCLRSYDFNRPIASLSFHACGDFLAVASGHRLHVWHYNVPESTCESAPVPVLRTRRSLRATHFHPRQDPLVTTTEVTDSDASCQSPLPVAKSEQMEMGQTSGRALWQSSYSAATAAARAALTGNRIRLDGSSEAEEGSSSHRLESDESTFNLMAIASAAAAACTSAPRELPSTNTTIGGERPSIVPVDPSEIESSQEGTTRGGNTVQTTQLQRTAAAAAAATNATGPLVQEGHPNTVRLRLWRFNSERPTAPLYENGARPLLTVPHAVLCSEMGAHFSPCGRYLAVCVACQPREGEVGRIHELRVYSLEPSQFGQVVSARPVKAPHCLTSVQFSPTSSHVLLAYGKRNPALLRHILATSTCVTPVYTAVEVCRLPSLELVRNILTTEDEVNVAAFHPIPGNGLAYGTKEGHLRVLHQPCPRERSKAAGVSIEDELLSRGNRLDSS